MEGTVIRPETITGPQGPSEYVYINYVDPRSTTIKLHKTERHIVYNENKDRENKKKKQQQQIILLTCRMKSRVA